MVGPDRVTGRLLRAGLLVAGSACLAIACVNLFAACVVFVSNGTRPHSTCSAMQFFGARTGFCRLETGLALLDRTVTLALTDVDPLLLWGIGACLGALMLLTLVALRRRDGLV